MAKGILAAVREAALADAESAFLETEETTGAVAPISKESGMSKDVQPAGGDKTGVTQADHDAAVATARAEGRKEGEARIVAALGADGVSGDAGRMSAALKLATKSPDMAGADVAAFVVENVAASTHSPETPEAHDHRIAAAGLAQPGKPAGSKKADHGWGAVVEQANKRRG